MFVNALWQNKRVYATTECHHEAYRFLRRYGFCLFQYVLCRTNVCVIVVIGLENIDQCTLPKDRLMIHQTLIFHGNRVLIHLLRTIAFAVLLSIISDVR